MLIKKNFVFRLVSSAILVYLFAIGVFFYHLRMDKTEKNADLLKLQGLVWENLQVRAVNDLKIILSSLKKEGAVQKKPELLHAISAWDRKVRFWVTDTAHLKDYFKVSKKEKHLLQEKENCGLLPDKNNALHWFCSKPLGAQRVLLVFSRLDDDFLFMAQTLDAHSFIVDSQNQPLGSSSFVGTVPDFPENYTSFVTDEVKGRTYLFLAHPLLSMRSTRLATLVSVLDRTSIENVFHARLLLFCLVFGGFLFLVVGWLIISIHYDLSWLSQVYRFLLSLSRGEMIELVEGDFLINDNESSDFFKLIHKLRENYLEHDMFLQERDRLTSKRARLVRRQLEILAQTLDKDSEEKIINELRQVQHTGKKSLFSDSFFSNFVSFSSLFKKLTNMVVDQQGRLQVLLKQLQLALINEAKLRVLKQELDIARSIQEARLPKDPPSFESIDLFAKMVSFSDVGGDFYDYFELPQHKLCFVVADVSGKGIPAALFMVTTRTLLRGLVVQNRPLNEIVQQLNELLCVDNPQAMFVTLFLGVIDTKTGDISYVNCGHPAPILLQEEGSVELLPAEQNIALAVIEGFEYKCQSVHLGWDDVLFIYTDGLTESSAHKTRFYGENRIKDVLRRLPAGRSAKDCAEEVLTDIEKFSGLLAESDDTTCLVIRYAGHTETPTHE